MTSEITTKIYDKDIGIERLLALIRVLIDPKIGCPWDVSQDHKSIAHYCIEEAYELEDAILKEDTNSIKKELGDILFQVIFHCNLGEKNNTFSFDDVIQAVCDKMIFRHPHVFDKMGNSQSKLSSKEIKKNWEKLKKIERDNDSFCNKDDLFVDIPNNLPALLRATKMQQRASELEYDFPRIENALDKIHEEIIELKEALNTKDSRSIEEEIGDVFFSLANLTRKLSLDPEKALRLSIDKFAVRINSALTQIKKENLTKTELDSKKLDEIWNLVKREQGKKNE